MADAGLAARVVEDLSLVLHRASHPVPVGVSVRHFHITEEHWRKIFGPQEPKHRRQLLQPGFWAAEETVTVEGPKGRIQRVRLVAPYRTKTQVEVSRSDAQALGIDAPVRGSGKLSGAAPVRITGPAGSIEVPDALIVAQRHVHFSPEDARRMKVADGEMLRVRCGAGGPRETVFEGVLARVSDKFALEFHVDTDEANAAWLTNGDLSYLV
ncbi:MAG: phosphate propanoyltransferase [Elusimicrobia bacterium]|nr:phosphate propanoyltransferase [Elusimicrobiota bacterium]